MGTFSATLTAMSPLRAEDPIAELVIEARDGREGAFGELVERLWPDLVGLARATLGWASADAEDMVQEAFLTAWGQLHALRDPASFPYWMRRTVVRRCLRQLRWRKTRGEVEVEHREGTASTSDAPLEVRRILARLPPKGRAVIYLTAVVGCTSQEAADALGMTAVTVRVHRHLAMKKLRKMLKESPS